MIGGAVSKHRGTTREARAVPSHFVGGRGEAFAWQGQWEATPELGLGIA